MTNSLRWRLLLTQAAAIVSVGALWPTLQYVSLSKAARDGMDPEKLAAMKAKVLRLGLDLQGGMHMVLEIDDSKAKGASPHDLLDRALEVVRNRVDEFGVTEPVVQKVGSDRIIVELAGIDDIGRAEEIIRRAAVLEFQMVRPGSELRRLAERLDLELADIAGVASADTLAETSDTTSSSSSPDTSKTAAEASAQGAVSAAEAAPDTSSESTAAVIAAHLKEDVANLSGRPLSSRILFYPRQGKVAVNEEAAVREDDYPRVSQYIEFLHDSTRAIPPDVELAWGSDTFMDDRTGSRMRGLYLLTAKPELTGELLEDARPQPDNTSNIGGNFLVEFDLTNDGKRAFSRTTGENVGRLMAIVLDGKVRSAPEIQEKIRAGTASITGRFTAAEASDLSVVLRAGALPVPISIQEQRAVGPTLGADSITMGMKSLLYGFIGILVFMLVYYRVGGALSVCALFLNILMLAAAMVFLKAVLTLPGIAGFVLTVGMSIDTNVLIFERMREELRLGQSFRNAVNRGYDKAFRTILDSNVTTLIAALALYMYGTGPIKGFAVVLAIGIVVSMFTGIFVTRTIFDFWTRGGAKSIPI
jgi:protein-export membrane protein SecD